METEKIKKIVRKEYAKIATLEKSCCAPQNSCCGSTNSINEVSEKIGYSEEELSSVPEGANLGLGCGNPVAIASLQEGDIVIDLGSGAGFDCFLAAKKVGIKGKVIGIDMTPEMIYKAKNNIKKGNFDNVEFRLGEIENLPVADNTANVIISNCVINLSTDKRKVFSETYRVLKPGGRLMISDIVLLKDLPTFIKESTKAYIGCLSGAMLKEAYIKLIKEIGFEDVKIINETSFPIDLITNDPSVKKIINDFKIPCEKLQEISSSVISLKVTGMKPN